MIGHCEEVLLTVSQNFINVNSNNSRGSYSQPSTTRQILMVNDKAPPEMSPLARRKRPCLGEKFKDSGIRQTWMQILALLSGGEVCTDLLTCKTWWGWVLIHRAVM